ncbi:hypothetical protein CHELA17_61636 [Chelatococcus asaccharovorans]|nr:hypothetical protein CHELA17_61636 [Chelatococcus asaccharovorans]
MRLVAQRAAVDPAVVHCRPSHDPREQLTDFANGLLLCAFLHIFAPEATNQDATTPRT